MTAGSTVLLAGCGSAGDGGDGGNGGATTAPGDGGDGGATTAPGDGGDGEDGMDLRTFVMSDAGAPQSLDPHVYDWTNTNNSYAYPENGYEPLLYFAPVVEDTEIVPLLATEVPSANNGLITNDGQTVEFPLRQGVTFHTGEEMTAEDVKFSWDRLLTVGISPGSETLGSAIESTEVVDDYTFRVNLAKANTPVFLSSVATATYTSVVSKAAVEANGGVQAGQENEWLAQNSAGTGPFVLGDRGANEIVWEAHEDYWGETGVDRVRQQIDSEVASRVAKLQRGDAHWIWTSPGSFQEVQGVPGIEIPTAPQFNPGGFMFNANIPYGSDATESITDGDDTVPDDFFADKDVRNAFKWAFDWDSFVEGTMSNLATRTRSIHVKGMFGFDPDAPMLTQDLEKTEELLKSAGYWEEGFRITLFNENNPEFDVLNLRMKDILENLNDRIEINSIKLPEGEAVEIIGHDPPAFPLIAWGVLPIGTDPIPYYKYFTHPEGNLGSRLGIPDVIDQRIIDLIDQAEVETDFDARRDQFAELQRLVFEEAPVALGYTPEIINPHLECVEWAWATPWIRPHFKHMNIDNC